MANVVVQLAGLCLWVLALVIVVQRQRVLDRRLARLEHRRGSAPPARHQVIPPEPGNRQPALPQSMPAVQQLARLARPLQRAGG